MIDDKSLIGILISVLKNSIWLVSLSVVSLAWFVLTSIHISVNTFSLLFLIFFYVTVFIGGYMVFK